MDTKPINQYISDMVMHKSLHPEGEGFSDYIRKKMIQAIVFRDTEIENVIRWLYAQPNLVASDYLVNNCDQTLFVFKEAGKAFGVVADLITELRKWSPYETAIEKLKHSHSHDLIDYRPEDDGVTHINVYSKGKTELGRIASNFAHTPFKHYKHGHFASIEAFWYWYSTGQQFETLRGLYGFKAKVLGKEQRKKLEDEGKPHNIDPVAFQIAIKEALLAKFEQHDESRELLKNSTLPLIHYYLWGDGTENFKISYPHDFAWIVDYISLIREWLNGKAYRVLIAGSRERFRPQLLMDELKRSELKAVEFISGHARGADMAGEKVAYWLKTPVRIFEADWTNKGKSAGYLRNVEMADYCDLGLIDWDNKSPGTKHMIDELEKRDKPIVLIKGE